MPRRTIEPTRTDARDWVTPDDLNVARALLGAPLARPWRRLAAIAIDVPVVALLSDVGNLWLIAGLALLVLLHLRGLPWAEASSARRFGVGALAVALLAIGAQQAWVSGEFVTTHHATKDDAPPESIPGLAQPQDAQARIVLLEAKLAQARQKRFDLKGQIADWADEVGLGLGWTIAYFSLLPAWWNGQTVGKRLLGLRVVELTGKPITVMRAFKRYGGYAAGMATGLLGFVQVFWDPNRQAIQDKTAHTVVIDLRRKFVVPQSRADAIPPEEAR